MKAIIVDDEKLSIKQFELESQGIENLQLAGEFTNPDQALEYVKGHPVELVLLDIEMPGMDGIILGRKIRKLYPDVVLIFITGYEKYAIDALKMKADYYLVKPYTHEDIEYILKRAKLLALGMKKRVYLRTFGRFDLFIDGQVVHLSNIKAKELLALCVDHRGGIVTMEEAVDKLWEGRAYDSRVKNLYRKAVMYLKQTFKTYGLERVFVTRRGTCNIEYGLVECDYFNWVEGKKNSREERMVGYYLSEYSWAEETAATLEQQMEGH